MNLPQTSHIYYKLSMARYLCACTPNIAVHSQLCLSPANFHTCMACTLAWHIAFFLWLFQQSIFTNQPQLPLVCVGSVHILFSVDAKRVRLIQYLCLAMIKLGRRNVSSWGLCSNRLSMALCGLFVFFDPLSLVYALTLRFANQQLIKKANVLQCELSSSIYTIGATMNTSTCGRLRL